MRVKRGVKARRHRKKYMDLASGFRGRSGNTIRQTRARAEKALCYAYRDRRVRKRMFRSLWITRVSAAAVRCGISYSALMSGLRRAGVEIDRKILAELGAYRENAFRAVVAVAKSPTSAS